MCVSSGQFGSDRVVSSKDLRPQIIHYTKLLYVQLNNIPVHSISKVQQKLDETIQSTIDNICAKLGEVWP